MLLFRKNRKFDAYMTVEASFIVPAATFIIILIIYLSFYMYGKCILFQDVYVLGFRGAVFYEERGYDTPEQYISERAGEQIKGRYFAASAPEISSSSKKDTVTVTGSLRAKSGPSTGYFKALPATLSTSTKCSVKSHDMPGKLRKIKWIKDKIVKEK